jgi:hypothetical protein
VVSFLEEISWQLTVSPRFGTDERLTEGYAKDIWEGGGYY